MYRSLRPHVRKLRRDFPFDAILAAWAYPDGVAAAHLAAEWDCPLVTMTLGSDINEMPHDPALKRQIQWGLGRSQRVVAVSSALRDAVVELGIPAEKVIVQRNGVDGERFMPRDRGEARAELGLAANRPLVVYIGNFKPEKGVDVLVDAMGRRDRLDVDLAMVGSGPLETILRERAASLGIESKIRFCGRRPHDEIPRWMAAADVICLPSYREGCPNVVLEALAAGRPVVASRVGGVPELLNDETGVLVPAGDPEALAQSLQAALARCWEPESLRASVSCLSWNQFGGRLGDTLQAAIIETGSATGAARRAI
jgi:glycosyltransferase involved in cell wall biosynthesis